MSGERRPPPLEKRCRATTVGQMERGAYWSPPKRCGNYAAEDGYCWQHQSTDQATGDPDDASKGST